MVTFTPERPDHFGIVYGEITLVSHGLKILDPTKYEDYELDTTYAEFKHALVEFYKECRDAHIPMNKSAEKIWLANDAHQIISDAIQAALDDENGPVRLFLETLPDSLPSYQAAERLRDMGQTAISQLAAISQPYV